jgi:hypothetical protein
VPPNPVVRVSSCPATAPVAGGVNGVNVGYIAGYVTSGGGVVMVRPG